MRLAWMAGMELACKSPGQTCAATHELQSSGPDIGVNMQYTPFLQVISLLDAVAHDEMQ